MTPAQRSEQPASRAEALVDLAEVLRRAGKDAEARDWTGQALQLYELKGDLVAAARVRASLSGT